MKRRFEMKRGGSSKFWEVEVKGGAMTVRFGRIGTEGQTQTKKLGAGAQAAADKMISEKARKGYTEVGASTSSKPAKAAGPASKTRRAALAKTEAPDKGQATGAGRGLLKALRDLDAKLKVYAPKRHAELRGAKSFKQLEKLVRVPAELRALWSWADGASELIVLDPDEGDTSGLDLMSVEHAASDLAMLRESVADFPADTIPFARDGSGNYFVLDNGGAVIDWDHETLERLVVQASLEDLLRQIIRAIDRKRLWGGPERKPGKQDPRVKRIEKLLLDAVRNCDTIIELSLRLDPADRYRVLSTLRDAVFATKPSPEQRSEILKWVADAAADARLWDEMLGALAEAGRKGGEIDQATLASIGRKAIGAGAFGAAEKVYGKIPDRHKDAEDLVGLAMAVSRTGRPSGAVIERAERAVAKSLAETEKEMAKALAKKKKVDVPWLDYLGCDLNLRAALEAIRGDLEKARATLREARTRCGKRFTLGEMPIAMGLK